MTVTLGQLIFGLYGLGYLGTIAAWKKHRVAVVVLGAILPFVGVAGYDRVDAHYASINQQRAVWDSMAPELQALYQLLAVTDSGEVRKAVVKKFNEICPDQKLSVAEYEQFVILDAESTIDLSERLIIDLKPTQIERTQGAVESLLASIKSVDPSHKIVMRVGPPIDLTNDATLALFTSAVKQAASEMSYVEHAENPGALYARAEEIVLASSK